MDTHELAWAAGFYDGEGCTSVTKMGVNGWPCVTLNVGQVDSSSLYRMAKAFGFGNVIGPFARTRHGKNNQPIHQFRICNFEQAQAAVAMMWKWLGKPKREQAAERLRAVAAWESGRSALGMAKSPRSRRVSGAKSCMKAGHPKPEKGICILCDKARKSSEEYKAWAREKQRQRRINNPEQVRAIARKSSAKRRITKREEIRQYAREYYAKNREKMRAYFRAYEAKRRAEKET